MLAPLGPFPGGLPRRDTASRAAAGHDIPPPPLTSGGGSFGPQSAGAICQHIRDTSTKRISTLDYMRKA
jgi:hypothetical protein